MMFLTNFQLSPITSCVHYLVRTGFGQEPRSFLCHLLPVWPSFNHGSLVLDCFPKPVALSWALLAIAASFYTPDVLLLVLNVMALCCQVSECPSLQWTDQPPTLFSVLCLSWLWNPILQLLLTDAVPTSESEMKEKKNLEIKGQRVENQESIFQEQFDQGYLTQVV